ncbi:hypothetical protein Tco_1079475 [Tanacetum coccineum]|uniref:Uncharacterized protein n=1 Tax=Tanacetum coccineum TaxID=301880 RepID=A0ABQ5HTG3_9ASTR
MKRLHPLRHHPLVDDDLDEEEVIREIEKKNLENVDEDETLEIDEIVNIKESRNHPLENVIGKLNQRTLRSQAQNKFNFYYFISTIEPKNVNEALEAPKFLTWKRLPIFRYIKALRILGLGACVFTDRWRHDELAYGIPSDGLYQTNLPSIEDIISSIRIDQDGQVCRIRHEEEIDVLKYQILTREIDPTLKPLKEIIWENVFCLGGNRDHVPVCLCYMLYCVVHSEKFNLAYFMAKRMEWVTKQKRLLLPYGCHSTSSSSAFDQPSSSHLNDDDDDGNDEGTSRASTPSPIRYVNSLTNQVPQVFQNPPNIDPDLEPFYTRQTEIINRQVQLRDEHRGGVRSIGKSLRRLWRNMKK